MDDTAKKIGQDVGRGIVIHAQARTAVSMTPCGKGTAAASLLLAIVSGRH